MTILKISLHSLLFCYVKGKKSSKPSTLRSFHNLHTPQHCLFLMLLSPYLYLLSPTYDLLSLCLFSPLLIDFSLPFIYSYYKSRSLIFITKHLLHKHYNLQLFNIICIYHQNWYYYMKKVIRFQVTLYFVNFLKNNYIWIWRWVCDP